MGLARRWLVAALGGLLLTVPAQAQIHTPNDHIPDFCASPTISSSAGSGRWSSPGTWSPARVPLTTDRVAVAPGTVVTFDVQHGAAIRCVGIHGELRFDTALDTRLWAGEVLVYADGHLQIGTAAQPVPAARTAEIVIANKALDAVADPDQYGTGLVAWGKVTIHGAAKQPTFVRAASRAAGGPHRPPARAPGDRLATGRPALHPRLAAGGREQQVQLQLRPPHRRGDAAERIRRRPERDGVARPSSTTTAEPGTPTRTPTVLSDGTRFLPHVGNLTRNVVIRSENPAGTRGHTLFTHRADVRIHYAQFQDLGRTRARAAPFRHQPHRPLPAPRASRLGSGQPVEHRLPVRARRQRGQRQPEVADRRPRQPLRPGEVERRLRRRRSSPAPGSPSRTARRPRTSSRRTSSPTSAATSIRGRARRTRPTARPPAPRRSASGRRASTTATSTTSPPIAATRSSRSSPAPAGSSSCRPRRTTPATPASAAPT